MNFIFMLVVLGFSQVSMADPECIIPWSVEDILSEGSVRVKQFTLDELALYSHYTATKTKSFVDFQRGVRELVEDVDPISLLKRQKIDYAKSNFHNEVRLFDLIINRKLGKISPISCLQSELLAEHLSWQKSKLPENEFQAYILSHDVKRPHYKIYFLSGVDVMPPSFEFIEERLKKDLEEGWQVVTHLHNHPFFLADPKGHIAGTTIPSQGDRTSYYNDKTTMGLKKSWITNGFSTITVDESEFLTLKKINDE